MTKWHLFQISVDPLISSTPFANIDEVSYFKMEKEILFSMHTVFRIGDITKIDNNNPLYEVKLRLTADNRSTTSHTYQIYTTGNCRRNRLATNRQITP
jgi:hypothetical protein